MKAKLLGLLAGAVFGFVITWARVTDPDIIRRMLLLKELDVFFSDGFGHRRRRRCPVAAMIGQGHLAGIVAGAGLLAGIALNHRFNRRVPSAPPASVSQPAGL
jgi:hypothetical protein